MGFFDALSRGLERSREALNEVFYFGGEVDEDFWEDLEDTLVMGDMGAEVAIKVSDDLRDAAAKKNLKTAPQLRRALAEQLEQHFVPIERDPFSDTPSCVLFVGINGAGKTTLLKAAAGLLPHTGQCLLDGVPLESLSTRRLAQTVSYIPQQSGISVSLSAREVVLMGFNPRLGVLQSPTAAMRAAADEALRTVGLANKAGQDYLTLSGGEKQLCILARTIAEDAPLLLLDEPDSALDLANRSRMTALLAQLVHTGGKTALVCLHDPALALDSCDILVVLQGGGVAAVLHPRTDPPAVLQAALAAVYGPLELLPVTDCRGRRRLALLPL